jgi:hypothetical protein
MSVAATATWPVPSHTTISVRCSHRTNGALFDLKGFKTLLEDKSNQRVDLKDLDYLRDPESWAGSYYELALATRIGTLDGPTQLHILSALQQDPLFEGFVTSRRDVGLGWRALDETRGSHYGVLRIPNKQIIGCRIMFLDNEYEGWCLLDIPMGMLELIYPVEYPVEVTSDWIAELDPVLAGIAARLYGSWPFVYGGLGEEASAMLPTAERIAGKDLAQPGLIVPQELFERFDQVARKIRLSDDLWWTGP